MAEGFGGNLRENGVGALAEFGVGYQDAHFAFGDYIDAGERIEIALAGAGEAGAVKEGAMPRPRLMGLD
jgi:hypothetical protein